MRGFHVARSLVQRSVLVCARLVVVVLSIGAAHAQDVPIAPDGDACVDVRIGSERSYGCLNRDLARLVPRQRFSADDAPLTATSPAPTVGTYNQAATRQRMGANFGHSAFPQRPPPPVFVPPSLGR